MVKLQPRSRQVLLLKIWSLGSGFRALMACPEARGFWHISVHWAMVLALTRQSFVKDQA